MLSARIAWISHQKAPLDYEQCRKLARSGVIVIRMVECNHTV
jgi:hypothetical protein